MKLFHEDLDEEVLPNYKRDFTGQKFGKWTAIEKIAGCIYIIQCECGKISKKHISMLQGLRTNQCRSCYRNSKRAVWFK